MMLRNKTVKESSCWDTTSYPFHYDNKIKLIFNREIVRNRKAFTNWIGIISKKHLNDIDWWISTPASRNPFTSSLYKNICITKTFKKLLKKNFFNNILVDSKKLQDLLSELAKKEKNKININYKYASNKKTKRINIFKSLLFQIIIYLFINVFVKKKSFNYPITLIDFFYTNSDLSNNRHYGGLTNKNFLMGKKIFFVPTFVMGDGIFNILRGIFKLSKNKNVIFKENYIKIYEVFKSYLYFFKINKFNVKYDDYEGVDYSSLIFEEIKEYQDPNTIIISKINYFFIRNLKKTNFKINKVINWFENQQADRSWNYSFRKNFPKIQILGYQGFTIYPQYMCTHPSKNEEKAEVIPKKIIVIGKAFVKSRKEFFPKAKILVGPALSYQQIYKYSKNLKKKIKVLIVLSGIKHIDKILLNWTINLCNKNQAKEIMIKSHPILPINQILEDIKLPKNLVKCEESLEKLLTESEIVVSCGPTSATLECLAYNCFLVVPVLDIYDKITFNYLNISKKKFKLVKNYNDFISLITKLIKVKNKKKNNENFKLKTNLFNKSTNQNLKLFY